MARHAVEPTKISRPRVAHALPRERLYQRLHDSEHTAVWISAPAGSGKTTLAAGYAEHFKLKTLWYDVDADDGDPATFFHYLGLAARKAAPRSLAELPHLTPEYTLGLSTFSRRFFERLYAGFKTPLVLVFDNFHALEPQSAVWTCLADAVAAAPSRVRVIVISRQDPSAEFARLRANGAMACLRGTDLRLTDDEALGIARRLGEHRFGIAAPNGWLATLVRKADGWAAGLTLLLEASGRDSSGALTNEPGGEPLFDYFTRQLFDGAEPEVQTLLMTSALLPSMAIPALKTLMGDAHIELRLRELYRRNYFVTYRTGEPPTYEFHALFREFLLDRAKRAWSVERLRELRCSGAAALLANGYVEAAIELWLLAEAWGDVATAVLNEAPLLMEQGRFQVLDRWLGALPEEAAASTPWLAYWHAAALAGIDGTRAARRLEDAFAGFSRSSDPAGLYLSIADGIQLAWMWGFDFAQMDAWLDRFEALDGRIGMPNLDVEARVLASLLMGLYFRRIGHPRIPSLLDRAGAIVDGVSSSLLREAVLTSVGWHYYGRRDFRPWLEEISGLLESRPAKAPPLQSLHLFVSAGFGRMHAGDADGALTAAARGLRLAEDNGVHVVDIMLLGIQVEAALLLQDLATADAALQRIRTVLAIWPNRFYRAFERFLTCWRRLFDEDGVTEATETARAAAASAEISGAAIPTASCQQSVVHALLEARELEQAAAWLERSRIRWAGGEHQHQAFQCDLTEAWLELRRGREEPALECLRRGLALGAAMGFGPPLLARPSFLYPVLNRALEAGIQTDYVKRLIADVRLTAPSAADLSPSWPMPVRIETLGPFLVTIQGTPLKSGLQRNRPLDLLKALIALGSANIAQERLAGALWPDAPGDNAITTLHTTLHRLRKLLEREDAVVLKDGHVSLNSQVVWVDVWAVEILLQRLERALERQDAEPGTLVALQRRISDLYRGRFLEFEAEQAWALRPADQLHRRVIDLFVALGKWWLARGETERTVDAYEAALGLDPLSERLHRQLMRAYADNGDFADALRVYERCRKALLLNLSVSPGAATTALYRSIRKRGAAHRPGV